MRQREYVRASAVGERYGMLMVTADAPDYVMNDGRHARMVECLCDCGATSTHRLSSLRRGDTTTCGCLAGRKRVSPAARSRLALIRQRVDAMHSEETVGMDEDADAVSL